MNPNQKLWEEHVKKEMKYLEQKEMPVFMEPRGKLDVGSDKPSSLNPTAVYKELEELRKEQVEYERKVAAGEIKLPEETDLAKYIYKSTSCYGKNWEKGIERLRHTKKWTKPKGMCEITRYADNYSKMSGKSPYAR